MYQLINENDFIDGFGTSNYSQYANNFSYNGKIALFEYLEDSKEDELGQEFDPIALCCEYTEYKNCIEAANQYNGFKQDYPKKKDRTEENANNWLNDNTTVIGFDGGVIIADF